MTRTIRRPSSSVVPRAKRTAPVRKLHRALFLAALGGLSLLPKISAQSISVSGAVTPGTPASQSDWVLPGQLSVGLFAPGTVTVSDGATITSSTGVIGAGAGGNGTVTITGTDSAWTLAGSNPSQLIVSNVGLGTLNLLNGGSVSAPLVFIGQSNSGVGNGTVLVSGAGSQLNASSLLAVGDGSDGALTVEAGGVVNAPNFRVGAYASDSPAAGAGRVHISGSGTEVNVSEQLVVGLVRGAEMQVLNGASLNSAQGIIGFSSSNSATVLVANGGTWNDTQLIAVGYGSIGTLSVGGNSTVSTPSVLVGTLTGGVGEIRLLRDLDEGTIGTLETASITGGAGTSTLTFDGGRLRATAEGNLISGVEMSIDAAGAYIDTQNFNTTIAGFLNGGDGGLIKEGTGTLTITNGAGYTGVTIVEAGTLRSTGFNSSEVIVRAGAVFGAQVIEGDLTVQGGGILFNDADPLLVVRGVIEFGTSFGIDNLVGLDESTASGVYEFIFNEGGDFTAMGLENFGLVNALSLDDGRQVYFEAYQGNEMLGVVVTSVIPEPASAAALAGLGMLGFAALRRRPRR